MLLAAAALRDQKEKRRLGKTTFRDVMSSSFGVMIALTGLVPAMFSACTSRILLMQSLLVVVVAGVLHVSTTKTHRYATAMAAADCFAGVLYLLTVAHYLRMFATVVKAIRLLWLVTILTASSTYTFLAQHTNISMLPNDVTIAAIGVSVVGLTAMSARARLCSASADEEGRGVLSPSGAIELLVIGGAMAVRFEAYVQLVLPVNAVGFSLWHASCWLSASVFLLAARRRSNHDDEATADLDALPPDAPQHGSTTS